MDYRLNRIDSEEKKRIISLHESATKKEYLSTGKKPLFEQGRADYMVDAKSKELAKSGGDIEPSTQPSTQPDMTNAQNAAKLIYKASKGAGTDTDMFIRGVLKIRSVEEFRQVDQLLKDSDYDHSEAGFIAMINGEFGLFNRADAQEIVDHLKTIGITATFVQDGSNSMKTNSFKITGFAETQKQDDQQQDDQQQDDQQQDDQQQRQQQSDRRQRLNDMTIAIQKEIGVEPDGKFGPKSINAAYAALSKK